MEDLVHRTVLCGRDVRMEPPISKRRKTEYGLNPSYANSVFPSSQNINLCLTPGKRTRQRDVKIWPDVISPHRPCDSKPCTLRCPSEANVLLSRISSWVDTRYTTGKVLKREAKLGGTTADHFLPPSANRRFLELHRDMHEECGPGARQHSWGAIETSEEVLLYGPYYPNYASGEHSEDFVVGQTEELLAAEGARAGGCGVYIFTQNSPCLDRNTQPCMLLLVEKALEWHARYGARTHVGYARCWGFNGNKEALFHDVDRVQLELAAASPDHESYLEAVRRKHPEGNLSPLSEDLFSAVRRLLGAGPELLEFPLRSGMPEQNWKGPFEGMTGVSECESRMEGEAPTQETEAMMEAARGLVSGGEPRSLEGHLEKGRTFTQKYAFCSGTCESMPAEARMRARLAFDRWWKEMVEGRYAEIVRNRLTEDFNRRVTSMFSEEVARFDKDYIQIGRIGFSEECAPSPEDSLL